MDATTRQALLERFAAYLDAADDTPEDTPDDATAEPAEPDLFGLLAELAALKNEVKLESRQLKGALEEFRGLLETLQQANARLSDELARRDAAQARAVADAERALLGELIELRDRVQAGHQQARRYRPTWLARRGNAVAFVAAMGEGMGMNLRRIDDLLARRGVRPIEVLGRAFDARTMQVGELVDDAEHPRGTVVAELRRGFVQGERLMRAAEVAVVGRATDNGSEQ